MRRHPEQPAAAPIAWATTYEFPPKTTLRLLAEMNERQRDYVMEHAQKVVALAPVFTVKETPGHATRHTTKHTKK